MLPFYHGLTTAFFLIVYSLINGFSLMQTSSWVLVEFFASTFMDFDHVVLSLIFNTQETVEAFSRPHDALTHPIEFFEKMGYENIKYHRTFTHILQILAVFFLLDKHPLFVPVFIGMVLHLISAMVGDRLTKKF